MHVSPVDDSTACGAKTAQAGKMKTSSHLYPARKD